MPRHVSAEQLTVLGTKRPDIVIGYMRKSSETDEKQVVSLPRQKTLIKPFATSRGYGEVTHWIEDEQSGKDFNRPGWKEVMRIVTRAKLQGQTGVVICNHLDRIARPVDEQMKASPLVFFGEVLFPLYKSGWTVDYVQHPTTGDPMTDIMQAGMFSTMAGKKIEELSRDSRDGKWQTANKGGWIGGIPPFPAERYDGATKTVLHKGQRASNTFSVLGPPRNKEHVALWTKAAKMLLAGETQDNIRRMLATEVKDDVYGRTFRNASVRDILSAVELIGRVDYSIDKPIPNTHPQQFTKVRLQREAAWKPIVDVTLFHKVQTVLDGSRQQHSSKSKDYSLAPVCFACGRRYSGATFRKNGEIRRMYVHPTGQVNDVQLAKTQKAGCKNYYVDADTLENAVRDLLAEQRGTPHFLATFKERLGTRSEMQSAAHDSLSRAEKRVAELKTQTESLMDSIERATGSAKTALEERLEKRLGELDDAKQDYERAQFKVRGSAAVGGEVLKYVEDAKNILKHWKSGVVARREIVAQWVLLLQIEIVQDDKPLVRVREARGHTERKRGFVRRLHAHLYTLPNVAPAADVESSRSLAPEVFQKDLPILSRWT